MCSSAGRIFLIAAIIVNLARICGNIDAGHDLGVGNVLSFFGYPATGSAGFSLCSE
ncbi:hypothetical protein ACIBG6_06970 [Streptomyces sp. NPDC050842]|uniref:hypothetical protein n=1 Tax=Streptomyces sp. NPDC050842 TaxID=3365636 RepID=UPI00378BBF97